MSSFEDYRRHYTPTPTADEVSCAELMPALRAFEQTVKRLVNPEPDIVEALGGFESTCSRLASTVGRLAILLSNKLRDSRVRRFEFENGLEKRKLPKIRKSMTLVGEGEAFINAATTARLEGRLDRFMAENGGSYEGWVERYRRRQAA